VVAPLGSGAPPNGSGGVLVGESDGGAPSMAAAWRCGTPSSLPSPPLPPPSTAPVDALTVVPHPWRPPAAANGGRVAADCRPTASGRRPMEAPAAERWGGGARTPHHTAAGAVPNATVGGMVSLSRMRRRPEGGKNGRGGDGTERRRGEAGTGEQRSETAEAKQVGGHIKNNGGSAVEEAVAAVSGRQGGDAAAVGGNGRGGEADGCRVGLLVKWKGVAPNGWGGFGRPASRCQRASWGAKRRRPPAARAPHPRKWVHLAPRCLKKSVASPVRGLDDWLPLAPDLVVRGRRPWSRRRVPTMDHTVPHQLARCLRRRMGKKRGRSVKTQ